MLLRIGQGDTRQWIRQVVSEVDPANFHISPGQYLHYNTGLRVNGAQSPAPWPGERGSRPQHGDQAFEVVPTATGRCLSELNIEFMARSGSPICSIWWRCGRNTSKSTRASSLANPAPRQ